MSNFREKISKELINFQTTSHYCKSLANYLFAETVDNNDYRFAIFQSDIFSIIDKLNDEDLKFTSTEALLIEKLKTLIIKQYQLDVIIMEAVRNDDLLNESYDRKIVEVNEMFADLKKKLLL